MSTAMVNLMMDIPSKFSPVGGGRAVSDVETARSWGFGGDMTETAVTALFLGENSSDESTKHSLFGTPHATLT